MSHFSLKLAILPSILLLVFVVGRNKKKRNPTSLLVWLSILGALSAIPAIIVELTGENLLMNMGYEPGTNLYAFLDCFFIIAMIEELGKFLGMLVLTWKNKNFDHSYDGVIYGVCSSLGFATLENVLYVVVGGIGTGILRAVSAIPLHCSNGVVMGFFYGKAKEASNNKDSSGTFVNMLLAYVCPLGMHGLYDFVLSVDDPNLLICLTVLVLIVAIMFLLVSKAAKEDHIIVSQPIWTIPYNFRYIPQGYYNQPNSYGQQGYYNQPNGYGQQGYYNQPNGYGQQGYYNQPNGYNQPDIYNNTRYFSQEDNKPHNGGNI